MRAKLYLSKPVVVGPAHTAGWLGVVRYVISSKKGQVLRRFPTMSQEKAEHFAATMRQLSLKARSVVRDLDPPVGRLG